jgi:serine/threonine protein kinase
MAEVYLATREDGDKQVAIKVLLPEMLEDDDVVKSFIDEAHIAAELTHPNVVGVYDFGHSGGAYYIVMEYVDGWDLRALLRLARRLDRQFPPRAAAYVVHEVAIALDYVHTHRRRILHRDVTPHNIFVTRQGHIKLGDFGVAKAAARLVTTQTGMIKGKLPYLAPEVLKGESASKRSDVYGLGLVLFELLTARRYIDGQHEGDLLAAAIKPPEIAPSQLAPAAKPLDAVTRSALNPQPKLRTRDAGLVADDLAVFLAEHPFDADAMAALCNELEEQQPTRVAHISKLGPLRKKETDTLREQLRNTITVEQRMELQESALAKRDSPALSKKPTQRTVTRQQGSEPLGATLKEPPRAYPDTDPLEQIQLDETTIPEPPDEQPETSAQYEIPAPELAERTGARRSVRGPVIILLVLLFICGSAIAYLLLAEDPASTSDSKRADATRSVDAGNRAASGRKAMVKADLSRPDVGQPDISQPDISQPDISQPDVSQPDISQSARRRRAWSTPSRRAKRRSTRHRKTDGSRQPRAIRKKPVESPSKPSPVQRSVTAKERRQAIAELATRARKRGLYRGDDARCDALFQKLAKTQDRSDLRRQQRLLNDYIGRFSLSSGFIQRKLRRLDRAIGAAELSAAQKAKLAQDSRQILRLVLADKRLLASQRISAQLRRLRVLVKKKAP